MAISGPAVAAGILLPSTCSRSSATIHRMPTPGLNTAGSSMSTLSILMVVACIASLLGIMDARAVTIDGRASGPEAKGLAAQISSCVILVALVLNFFWLWRICQWYVALGLLAALALGARSLLTLHTLRFWLKLRLTVTIATAASAIALWLIHPPP